MSTQKPPHTTAADALPDDRQTVLRTVNGSCSGVMHIKRDCDALSTADKVVRKDARTPNTHRQTPEPPDEPGCSACPEGINDHGDLTTRNKDPGPKWKCARCGNRWTQ